MRPDGAIRREPGLFLENWPDSGGMRNGCLYPRQPWELPRNGNASSSWPGPRAEDAESCGGHGNASDSLLAATQGWPTPNATEMENLSPMNLTATSVNSLATRVQHFAMAHRHVTACWPTPVANDDNKSPDAHRAMKARMKDGPRTAVTSLNVYTQTWPTPHGFQAGNGPSGNEYAAKVERWPTPAARDWKSADASTETMNRNASPLNEVAAAWATPQAHDANTPKTPEQIVAARMGGAGVKNLNEQAVMWRTPDALTGGSRIPRIAAEPHSHQVMLQERAEKWQTPGADSFRSRGGDRKSEMDLDRQCRSFRLDRGWLAMALSIDWQSFTPETLAALSSALWPNGKTASDGADCWCGFHGCSQPSHKRRLNPLFVEWEMGWRAGWSHIGASTRYGLPEMASYLYRQRRLLWNCFGGG